MLTIIPIEKEPAIRVDLETRGYSPLEDRVNGPAILLRDSSTGAIFESLSDQHVLFVTNSDDQAAVQRQVLNWYKMEGSGFRDAAAACSHNSGED